MVENIRKVEQSLGSNSKHLRVDEEVCNLFHHGITASMDIKKGEEFTTNNLTSKRPLLGIPTNKIFEVLGKKASRNVKNDEQIMWKDVC